MNFFRQIVFTVVAVCGLALAVSAQKDDRGRPPKEKPPVVVPGGPKKPPPQNPPKGDDRPKKPGYSWFAQLRDDKEIA